LFLFVQKFKRYFFLLEEILAPTQAQVEQCTHKNFSEAKTIKINEAKA